MESLQTRYSDVLQKNAPSKMNGTQFLPMNIIMMIFSFITINYEDIARLRLISKEVRNSLYKMIRFSANLQCCDSDETGSFFEKLLCIGEEVQPGSHWELSIPSGIFSGFQMVGLTWIGNAENIKIQKSAAHHDFSQICHQICETKSWSEFKRLSKIASRNGMFLPVSSSSMHYVEGISDAKVDYELVILTFEMRDNGLGQTSLGSDGNTVILPLMESASVYLEGESNEDEPFSPRAIDKGFEFRGYVRKNNTTIYQVKVPMCIRIHEKYEFYDFVGSFDQTLVEVTDLLNTHQLKPVKEGVAIVDGAVHTELHRKLIEQINNLSMMQDVDYHPHSNDKVRDLVHPALYAYVKGVSKVLDIAEIPPCEFSANITAIKREPNTDYWGRRYETSAKYQWLPTYFEIKEDGCCKIHDYINNLVPRQNYTDLYASLEELFALTLPLLETVYSYGRALQRRLLNCNDNHHYENNYDLNLPVEEYCSLKGKKLQVITKIVDYELGPEETYEGVWHVEGMSHEDIVATSIYILERDEDIVGGNILFKRAYHAGESKYVFFNVCQCRQRAQEDVLDTGLVPLGQVETLPKRLLAFPNSHVHKVSTIEHKGKPCASCKKGAKLQRKMSVAKQKRRIIVFFLVNPEKRIISTREVPPQQMHAGGSMTRDEAFEHRIKLMRERKYTKQDWNVREIELCEH